MQLFLHNRVVLILCFGAGMNNTIDSLASTTFAGKRFNRKQLVEIQQTVNEPALPVDNSHYLDPKCTEILG
jgi:hypothetical protein